MLAKIARAAHKPLFCWILGSREPVRAFTLEAQALGIPVYREIGRSIECMATLRRNPPSKDHAPGPGHFAIEASIAKCLKRLGTAKGVLDEFESKRVLADAGIPTVAEAMVATAEDAVMAAGRIGYPIVLKGVLADVVHKAEAGLVRTGLHSADELKRAFAQLAAHSPACRRFLIQRQIAGNIEIIAGLIRDRQFGPCVMCGLGGIFAEALADRVFAAAPLSREDALGMIGRLKSQHLLDGWRGQAAVDRPALADIIVALAQLGSAAERIEQIDVNPLIIADGRPVAVDATIILKAWP